tara:strand:- start:434 stop:856 length:423 start_codon:yes stop_codon:yes gene_type:complete
MSWKNILKTDNKEEINPADKDDFIHMFLEHSRLKEEKQKFQAKKNVILNIPGIENVFNWTYDKLNNRLREGNPTRMTIMGQLMRFEDEFKRIENKEEWNKKVDAFAQFLMTTLNNIFSENHAIKQSANDFLREKGMYMEG